MQIFLVNALRKFLKSYYYFAWNKELEETRALGTAELWACMQAIVYFTFLLPLSLHYYYDDASLQSSRRWASLPSLALSWLASKFFFADRQLLLLLLP